MATSGLGVELVLDDLDLWGGRVGDGAGVGHAAACAPVEQYTAWAPLPSSKSAVPINALKIRTVTMTIPVMRDNSSRVGQMTFLSSPQTCAK